ncbi:HNH endonuclease [Tsukamurella paurometabola]|uniref:HNH endonuclease n=1 Tax=Tsukamurella paurometabola TaxID=2061 RepID=UPI000A055F82|nr:HNH endonuclease [Tsukamurella paurometabola]
MARPCLRCGTPSTTTRCSGCSASTTKKPRSVAHAGSDSRWRRISLKAREQQPWCLDCGTTSDLTADHILPVSDYPELAHEIENVTVRCRSCNSRRRDTYTPTEAQDVLKRLESAHERTRKAKYRSMILVAQKAVQTVGTRGEAPPSGSQHPVGKARGPLLSTVIVDKAS